MLLTHPKFHIYKGSPAYWAVQTKNAPILYIILQHPDFDINKRCVCCENRLAIEGIYNCYRIDDFQDL